MTFKDQMANDLDNVFFNTDEFAVEVVYTPKATGVGQSIKALVDYGLPENIQGNRGDGYTWTLTCERDVRSDFVHGNTRSVATVTVNASDIPEPKYRDIITIDGVEFRVTEIFDHA